jgi:hypothetical protein
MAYTRTVTMTRPNTGVELPKVADSHPDHDTVSRTKYAEAGITKTYTWDEAELVLSIAAESTDKAAFDSLMTDLETLPDEIACRTAVKSACQAAGITILVNDSEGNTLASY